MKYDFKNPPEIYRGLDLWMINDKLNDEELVNQVEEFRKKGLYSVIFRTYNGLVSDYPGPDYMHKARVVIEAAERVGLKIALQAGYMPAAYPGLPEEYTLRRIRVVKNADLAGDETILARHGDLTFVEDYAAGAVDMFNREAVAFYVRTTYEEMWAHFREHFGKTVISVWVDEPRFSPKFIILPRGIETIFEEKYGYTLLDKIPQLYFDVGDYKKTRYHYHSLLAELMGKYYFTAIRDWCHSRNLTFSGHLMAEELLRSQVGEATAIMPFYRYFDIPGIDILRTAHDWYDKPLTPLRQSWDTNAPDTERSNYICPVQCASACEQAGKEHMLCEMYGVSSLSLGFRDMMHQFDFFAVNGVNHQCMHALFYSPAGFRKRFYPQLFNTYQPFWKSFRAVKDYVARVSAFTSLGKCTTDVLVLHPIGTAYGLHCGNPDPNDPAPATQAVIRDYDHRHYRLIMNLYGAGIPFHYGDMTLITDDGAVEGNRFVIGHMSYGTVVLPNIELLTAETLALLEQFAHNGGRIVAVGQLPTRLDGEYCRALPEKLRALPGLVECATNEQMTHLLSSLPTPYTYRSDRHAANTLVRYRREGDVGYFMICNDNCRRGECGELTLDGLHSATRFDAETGEQEPLPAFTRDGRTVIPVTLPAGGSILIMTEATDTLPSSIPAVPVTRIPLAMDSCTADSPNLMTLELCSYKTESMEEFSREYFIERIGEMLKQQKYTGMVTLRFRFRADHAAKNLQLVIEEPEACEITLNGVPVDNTDCGQFLARAFRIVKLPDAVVEGDNFIDIRRFTKPQEQARFHDPKHLFELFTAPKGIDLERIHLLGDFHVEAYPEVSYGGMARYAPRFLLTEKKPLRAAADLTAHGLPFYAGSVRYEATLRADKDMLAHHPSLTIGRYSACTATVYVNGRAIGNINRDPYRLSLDGALTEGENRIAIEISGSLRNMAGPSHIRDLDPASCSKLTWITEMQNTEYTEYDVGVLTNSFVLAPFGIADVTIEIS